MNVVIAGETPFVQEVSGLCQRAGHKTVSYLVEDFMAALQTGTHMTALDDADVVIELHNESIDSKRELLFTIGNNVSDDTLILCSALPMSATEAAALIRVPQRVVGFSVIPPLGEKVMVELAAGLNTTNDSMARAIRFWDGLDCSNEVVADGTGLVRARILCCLVNEACSALQEGVASAGDIDLAMRLGTNYPRGPLEWADYLGLDTVLGVMEGLYREWGEDRYRPNPLLKRYVLAGKLGEKAGGGFYQHGG